MRGDSPTEGRSGVPLRFPRPVMPVIATVIAAVWVVTGNAPAFADQVRAQEWWLSALDVTPAWQLSKGGGVTVAVLSDGVDAAHADLAGAVTAGPDFTNSGETTSTFVGLQGTAIASLIAGRGHGPGHSSGVVGVAPRARVLSVRVTLDPGDPALDQAAVGAGLPGAIASGIRYAVAHHARVIDLPVDPGQPSPDQVAALPIPPRQTTPPELTGITAAAGGSSAEQAAVAYAVRKGVVLVAPAGDNGTGTDAPDFPAAYPGVIAVGAFDQNFVRATFSSRQPYVALTAGGAGVIAADAAGGYEVVDSTSGASAMVSGIAALIRARFPKLSAAQVTTALTSSAVYQPADRTTSGSGRGTVDAGRALIAAAAMAAPANERAGAGAVSLAAPTAPSAAPATSNALAPRVLRAAIISAAALILLLLLVTVYAAAGRRKERQEARDAQASADWVRSNQNAYPPYGSGEAEQMLEYFPAPSSNPAIPVDPFAPFQGAQFPGSQVAADVAAEAGASRGTGTLAPSSVGALGTPGTPGTLGALGGRGVGAWVPLGAASRAQSRQPRVSGAPPWEPAAQPNSELPWAAVPGPPADPAGTRPAVADSPASDSIWPTTVRPAPAPSPSGQVWEDLVSSAPPAVEAQPPATPAPPQSAGDAPAPAGGPAPAAFSSPAPLSPAPLSSPAPATPGRAGPPATPGPAGPPAPAGPAGAADLPASAGSLWQPRTTPRSPSGSLWELPASESGPQPSAAQDSQWQQAGGDAFRQPAAAEPNWPPPGGQAGWPSATEQVPAAPSESRGTGEAEAAGQEESARAEAAWDAQGSSTHWLAAAVSERWQPPADADSPRRPAADSPAVADSGWHTTAAASWDAAGSQTHWDAAGREGDSVAGGDEPYAWRPSAPTETFPAVSDD